MGVVMKGSEQGIMMIPCTPAVLRAGARLTGPCAGDKLMGGKRVSRRRPKQTLTITLEAGRRTALERMAELLGRERDAVIDEALANWLDLQARQTHEIEAGLAEADAGNFASDNG